MNELISTQPLRELLHQFHSERIGTDMSLTEYNTIQYLIFRGLIGESVEMLDAVENGTVRDVRDEFCDLVIFLFTIADRMQFSDEELNEALRAKIDRNNQKYALEHFQGRTIREAMAYSRSVWNPQHEGLHTE